MIEISLGVLFGYWKAMNGEGSKRSVAAKLKLEQYYEQFNLESQEREKRSLLFPFEISYFPFLNF